MGRHTSQGVQKGGPFCFVMTLPPYTKPYATAADRVAHLRARGLLVARPKVAAAKIEMIGYERLRIYFLSRRDHTLPGKPFLPGTTYQDILRIYACDGALRDICFAAVGQFEILLRNSISEAIALRYGSHPYFNQTVYSSKEAHLESIRLFADEFAKTKDQRAKHYRETYASPALPAIWTIKEFLTFGKSSRLLKGLNGPLTTVIAKDFGLPSGEMLQNWVEALVDLRNICAHHDRLFNRAFQKQPTRFRSAGVPAGMTPNNKLRALLQCLDHMMTCRGAPVHVETAVLKPLKRFPEVRPSEAGY